MNQNKHTGTLIYSYGGISVTLLFGVYTVSDGVASVVADNIDCFNEQALRSLLAKKATVKSFVNQAKPTGLRPFSEKYFAEHDFEIAGRTAAGKEMKKYMKRISEEREMAEMGY